MKQKINRVFFLLCTIISFTGYSQSKEAYISKALVFKSIPNYEKNQVSIDSLTKVYQETIKLKQADLEKRSISLREKYAIRKSETMQAIKARMEPIDTLKLSQLDNEYNLLENQIKVYNDKLKVENQTKIIPVQKQISIVVDAYLKKNNIKVLHNLDGNTSLLFVDKTLNITEAIIAALKAKKTEI